MNPETKSMIETLIKRPADETDLKVFEVLTEMAKEKEDQHPVKFSLDFGKRCFEMGKDEK